MNQSASLPKLSMLWSWGVLLWIGLTATLLFSAIAVVWVKHQVRLISTELHVNVKKEYGLRVEEGRLQLEYNHLLSRARIEQLAKQKLGIQPLSIEQERVLLLPEGAIDDE